MILWFNDIEDKENINDSFLKDKTVHRWQLIVYKL